MAAPWRGRSRRPRSATERDQARPWGATAAQTHISGLVAKLKRLSMEKRMAHLWFLDDEGVWSVVPLEGRAVDISVHPPRAMAEDYPEDHLDRKSTRLNSSHLGISYAV